MNCESISKPEHDPTNNKEAIGQSATKFCVAIQGELGSFHHEAAKRLFGANVEILACKTFEEVFDAAKSGRALIGLAAVENSEHGPVNNGNNADLLESMSTDKNNPGQVFAGIDLLVKQTLIALQGVKPEEIKWIFSHPAALDQCRSTLDDSYPYAERVEYYDTAAAVEHIIKLDDPTCAAIAGETAAELSSDRVQIIDSGENNQGIQDNPHVTTRFFAFSQAESLQIAREKLAEDYEPIGETSIIFYTEDKPSALLDALEFLREFNMTRIRSHVIRKQSGYSAKFHVDIATDPKSAQEVIEKMRAAGINVVELGNC